LPTALAHHPDVLFIEFAINDAYLPYMVSKAISKANLKTMIDMTLANGPNTEVVVQTMNNCLPGSESAQMRPELADYYQGYRDVISKDYSNNPRVLLIDNYPSWVNLYQSDPATWNKCVPDGIHPSGEGTALITIPNIKAAMLAQATPEPSTLVLILCGTAVLLILGSIKPRAWWRNDQKTGSQ
jgi:lysophospholipase L1-like esterase